MSIREAYEKKMEAQLEAWEREIAEAKADAEARKAKAKLDEAEANRREEIYEKIDDLKQSIDGARDKLAALKRAGDDAWDDVKGGLENTWKDLRRTMDTLVSDFRS